MRVDTAQRHLRIGTVGLVLLVTAILAAQFLSSLPLVSTHSVYKGYFGDTAGIQPGDHVEISGTRVGSVETVDLDGDRVLIAFSAGDQKLGDRTRLAIKTGTVLGKKFLEVSPGGSGTLRPQQTIPIERTFTPYLLTDSLSDLSKTIGGLDTDKMTQAMTTLSGVLDDTEPELAQALKGVSRFSDTVSSRDESIQQLLGHAESVTEILARRSDQINRLLLDGNTLLGAVDARKQAVDSLFGMISAVTNQLTLVVDENEEQLSPVLTSLNETLDVLRKRQVDLAQTIKPLSQYATSLGEAVAGGPFFKAYVVNLLPGQYLQPFIDAAFKDQGVDPASLQKLLPGGGRSTPNQGSPNAPVPTAGER